MTYEIHMTGFKTKAQAEEFVKWYEGQGEQEAAVWFECRKSEGVIDTDFMPVDCIKTYPLVWSEAVLKMELKIET